MSDSDIDSLLLPCSPGLAELAAKHQDEAKHEASFSEELQEVEEKRTLRRCVGANGVKTPFRR